MNFAKCPGCGFFGVEDVSCTFCLKYSKMEKDLLKIVHFLRKTKESVQLYAPHPATRCDNEHCWCHKSRWYHNKEVLGLP